ncbi:Por secretion system C-terminal sorting domain-containing protein [Aquiflexum balticum DSM 16537]|uniref:Por secretion system C-terminal sorting domain-containing protein n=1 Tax=Aquiflexum balticum DSM 16537 TaxID=758820 RepID=A0A1W2HAE3_9BACT|nr:T9SS type A sorting domain-containing protein [Aquiflexum balticum]SMD45860.1 Por secretion system C-terminal sorting domain-containing protein [Aquiflexum balticum DSM 16537]
MKKKVLLFICFALISIVGYSQISTDEIPPSFYLESLDSEASAIDHFIATSPSMELIAKEDREDQEKGLPPRFGYPIDAGLNLSNSGKWAELPNGDKVWILKIISPGAHSINLLYDKFWIPEGSKFFVYSEDKRQVHGAFTSKNNKGTKNDPVGFATTLVFGENTILEYYLPKGVEDNPVISIEKIVHGYRDIGAFKSQNTTNFGGAGNCQVNVNCPEGTDWQEEKNAVALILVNGIRECTGSLIVNSCMDDRAYFLTADHCLYSGDANTNPNLFQWSFYWHYESPGCANPGTEPPILATSGAVVVANNPVTDFALLELIEHPGDKTGVSPYFLGWDRSGNAGTGGVGIHHPRGDLKKISTYSGTPTNSTCLGGVNHLFWQTGFDATQNGHSIPERGSSGSPLINSGRRVIGQLLGPGNCPPDLCSTAPELEVVSYGKFDVSWTGNNHPDVRRRLNHWLHPGGGTAPLTMDGKAYTFISGPDYLCSTYAFTLQNAPAGSTVSWSVSPTHLFSGSTSGSGSSAPLSPSGSTASGQATITFAIDTDCGEVEMQRPFWVGRARADIIGPYDMPTNTVEAYYAEGGFPYMGMLHLMGITDYQWSVYPSGYDWIYGQGMPGITLTISFPGFYSLGLDVTNPCGVMGTEIPVHVYNPWEHFTLYPNPTSDILHISLDPEARGRDVDQDFEVSLYDGQGRELIPAKPAHQQTSLNLSRIPKGFYYVHIRYKDALLRRQIRVER